MIDIHTHLLPGVDDGSPSMEVSVPVLERFEREGVEVVVCTPHLLASRAHTSPNEEFSRILDDLRARAPVRPRLELGWEIMLDAPDADLTGPNLGLAGSNAVLVEFPRINVPEGAARELTRLRSTGIVPVLAHPERYWGCTPDLIRSWRDSGAVIQLDSATLLGNPSSARLARELLEQGLVDCIASDNHGDLRSLAGARQWLEEIGADEQARLLTHANAERLLSNEGVLPVAPLAGLDRGMLSRLKQLVLGRG